MSVADSDTGYRYHPDHPYTTSRKFVHEGNMFTPKSSTIEVKVLNEKATIPTRGSDSAAGYDLYACIDDVMVILPNETVKIGTGVAITPPLGTFGAIFPRSGLATKNKLRLANCVGVADEDYTGEYIVALHNDSSDTAQIINPNDRIAQVVFIPYTAACIEVVDELQPTKRGDGGFGSTGD